jgi:small RNA 2'-O-methyltransferase
MHRESMSVPSMMDGISILHEIRLDHVLRCIRATGGRRILDLGCGSGLLLDRLATEKQFEDIVGLESCPRALARARQLLAEHPDAPFPHLKLVNGSYAEAQPALRDYDVAVMVETIEHVKPGLLSAVEHSVFGQMRPRVVYLTTPNREYNPLFGLSLDQFREPDHKFEWDRAKFAQWVYGVSRRNGYRVQLGGIGEEDPELGPPTQTAFFSLGG